MSSKENKKMAQKRRAMEREKEHKKVIGRRILIGVVAIAFVGFLVFMTIKNPGKSESTEDAETTESTDSDTSTEETVSTDDTSDTSSAGTLDTTEGREVAEGDTVAIDYVGTKDGVEFEGGTGSYDLTIGSGAFIEGFEDGLIGHTVGETVELNLTFPENYGASDLAGADVVFTVTINGIYDY